MSIQAGLDVDKTDDMLLKKVQSSRENKSDHKDSITVVPSTPVDIVIIDRSGIEMPSLLCETTK